MNFHELQMNHPVNFGDAYAISAEVIDTGDGTASQFTGNLANTPLAPGSVTVTDGTETFSDNGDGTLTGDQGGSGTIDYYSGAYDITFNTAPTNAQDITSGYDRFITSAVQSVTGEDVGSPEALGQGNQYDSKHSFGGQLANKNTIPGTFSATVSFSGDVTFTDDGEGNLSGSNLQSGTINYDTGEFFFVFSATPDNGDAMTIDYDYGYESANEKILARDVKGVYSVEVENKADGEVGLSFLHSSDLSNWTTLASTKVGQSNKKFVTISGVRDYLKVIGAGGEVNLQFHS